ncbi:hypothetical protein HOP50_03g23760 [Chloropicon primus]|uniref:Auxin efflux carrier protein n=2 Tax=Chloropicon primus TaxID=1764295 RepID=A0A5B8MHD6_9CHLO|nr:hypothetical protein A3770_03p23770 [Chloropicon primus]UPQ99070.1 hypothetical protein HOP50_03g23760 [Chloropicon primus]|eukprot:QDZ19859.1 hypothetical protein A3770_03p23770 [Chloropicon primus]
MMSKAMLLDARRVSHGARAAKLAGPSVPRGRVRACARRGARGTPSSPPQRRGAAREGTSRGLREAATTARAFDQVALSSACSTTFKLVLLCGVISKLMKIQMLPSQTPVILSKVAFNVLLPCLLCSKVAVTLIKLGDPSMLGVPIVGFLQIGVGLAAGAVLYSIAERFLVSKEVPAKAMAVGGASDGPAEGEVTTEQKTSQVMKSIVKASCAFGNSVTLPLIFFSTLLSGAQYDLAAGYTALFLIAWSPALWSLGYAMFVSNDGVEKKENMSFLQKIGSFLASLKQYMNPPMIGVLAGVVIGLTPLSNVFFPSTESMAGASFVTKLALGIPKSAMELVELMAGSLLAIQTMVLAASLLPTDGPKDKPLDWKELLSPKSKLEVGALIITLFVRFLVVPFAGLGIVNVFQTMKWLPNDPICYLVVLVQAVMPSAQNIVLLMNLQSSTRPLAPVMARILLQIYLLSVVPLALWMGFLLPMIGLGG